MSLIIGLIILFGVRKQKTIYEKSNKKIFLKKRLKTDEEIIVFLLHSRKEGICMYYIFFFSLFLKLQKFKCFEMCLSYNG